MSWEDVQDTQSSGGFMKLVQGDNKVRVVSDPFVRHTHWINNQSLNCTQKTQECRHCLEDQPKTRFAFYVIDRKDGQCKILEVGSSIAGALKKLKCSEDYWFSSVPSYDVTVTRSGEGMNTEYTVMPARNNTELTLEETQEVSALKPLSEVYGAIQAKERSNVSVPVSDEVKLEDIPF